MLINMKLNEQSHSPAVFTDPVTYLARFGIVAELVVDPVDDGALAA